ncbi:MAG: MFS transporter [Herpetosiphonaceae bacterium]|nr:MFS transporter [Herpetosiphonaceae bacterium]
MFRLRPTTVYLTLQAALALCLTMIFTVAAVYRVQTVGMNPLQLVLVGTALEIACFLFEVPTGVVADVFSRRLSIIIGVFLLGAASILEGSIGLFGAILLAQVVWGFGYTFTSGATEAWIADEVGEAAVEQVFLRGVQVGQLGALLGTGIGVALASIQLNLPIIVGGGLIVLIGLFLVVTMPENGFKPAPREDRTTWHTMGATLREGVRSVRGRPLLITLLAISAVAGMASEGFDRLWQNHLLVNFSFPSLGGLDPVVWFGIINAGAMLISIVAVEVVNRRLKGRPHNAAVRALFAMYLLLSVSVVLFGLAQQFGLALAAFWASTTLRRTSGPLYTAWLNRNIPSQVRATVISMSSQSDALGQIVGGPLIGLLATGVSLRAAMIVTGLSLAPVLLLFGRKGTLSGEELALSQ